MQLLTWTQLGMAEEESNYVVYISLINLARLLIEGSEICFNFPLAAVGLYINQLY